MPLPEIGQPVPDFTLPEFRTGTAYHLAGTAAQAPTLLAFFKRSCATSRLTLPFIERLHQHYPGLQPIGISQDDLEDTTAFVQDTRLTFPVLLDTKWKVSTEFDLFTVPSVFLLDKGGAVRRVNLGWNAEQYTALSDDVARALAVNPVLLLTDADKVPAFKPG